MFINMERNPRIIDWLHDSMLLEMEDPNKKEIEWKKNPKPAQKPKPLFGLYLKCSKSQPHFQTANKEGTIWETLLISHGDTTCTEQIPMRPSAATSGKAVWHPPNGMWWESHVWQVMCGKEKTQPSCSLARKGSGLCLLPSGCKEFFRAAQPSANKS